MKKSKKKSLWVKLLAILSLWVLTTSMVLQSVNAADTTVTFSIAAGTITYGWPAALTFSTPLPASFTAQSINENFTWGAQYFWVQDLLGNNSWYATTLQMSWHLVAEGNIISWSNVSFQAVWGVTTLSGTENPRVVLDAGTAWYQALSSARTYIKRDAAVNSGVIGYYGSHVNIKIDVPAWQAAGSYAGTMIYTLIEN